MEATDDLINSFARRWKALDFTGRKEADVREMLITPLLYALGYSENTINDIQREETLGLSELYHRIGQDKIRIDYVPTLRLNRFWIIEAKAPRSGLPAGDLLQAHLYAIHPEVQARYIVLTNGREIRLYDAYKLLVPTNKDAKKPSIAHDYELRCTQDDCETTFPALYQFLSAKTMLSAVRDHMISTLNASLEHEIDEDVLNQLQGKLFTMVSSARPQIKENAREISRRAWRESQEVNQRLIETSSFDQLLTIMDFPTNGVPKYGGEVAKRIAAAEQTERIGLINQLIQRCSGRVHSVSRVHAVDALIRLTLTNVSVPSNSFAIQPMETLGTIVANNMSYWASSELLFALVHLDNATIRIAKKFGMAFSLRQVQRIMKAEEKTRPKEELLADVRGLTGRMVLIIGRSAEQLWRQFSVLQDVGSIWKAIWTLEAMESAIEEFPKVNYPPGQSDLLSLDYYGRGFDMLCMGTWDLVNRNHDTLLLLNPPPAVVDVLNMSREEALAHIPASKPAPADLIAPAKQGFETLFRQAVQSTLLD